MDEKGWERTLTVYVRIVGLVTMGSVVGVAMPYEWMNAINQWCGLGELPHTPIVGYLTRSLSGLYLFLGMIVVFLSFDVRRYQPLIGFAGWLGAAFGVGVLVIGLAVDMPVWWCLGEGIGAGACFGGMALLATKVPPGLIGGDALASR